MIFGLLLIIILLQSQREEELGDEVEDLNAAEDREAGEESHCPSNQANSANQGHLLIIFVFISF